MSKNNVKPFELLGEYERLSLLHKVKSNESQEWGGASEVGFQVGVKLLNKFKASIGGTFYLWGYPTETIGSGVFVATEIGIEF